MHAVSTGLYYEIKTKSYITRDSYVSSGTKSEDHRQYDDSDVAI